MSKQVYIVTDELLTSPLLRGDWEEHTIPGDPSKHLLFIEWDNHNDEAAFEILPGVLMLGQPWEPTPAEAIPLLTSFQDAGTVTDISQPVIDPLIVDAPVDTVTAPVDSVATALKKTGVLAWRQIR